MPRERVLTGYDVVDNHYFRQKAEEVRSQRLEVRQKCVLPENTFLLRRVSSRRRTCRGSYKLMRNTDRGQRAEVRSRTSVISIRRGTSLCSVTAR